jgi:dipeptide transport system substrate-binding protein
MTFISKAWLTSLCLVGAVASAQELVYCAEGSPEFFSPSISYTATSLDVTQQMFDNLVTFESGTTHLKPALATHWQVSDDGRVYTFFLRRGVKWQSNASFKPKRDFNADDVIFTLERSWKPQHPYFHVTHSEHPYFKDLAMGEALKQIRKVDDHTVEFTLTEPVAPFVANLAMSWAGIQSAEYGAALLKAGKPELLDQMPLGTGPFQWVSYQKDAKVVFKAFDQHWGGRAKVDSLIFAIEPDPAVRLAKLQSGQCHVLGHPNPIDIPLMRHDERIKVLSQTGLNTGFLVYNMAKKPFDDVRVRRALNMAINKRKILRSVYQHTAVPAINPIPPIQWGYNREVEDDVYDPEGAKKLLAEAGYADGFSTDLWAMAVQRPYMPNAVAVAKLMRDDLAEVGVKVEIKSPDWTRYVQGMKAGEHQMGLFGWVGDNGDPDNFLHTLLGCSAVNGFNVARFCDPQYDDVVKQAKRISDTQQRTRLYQRAQVIVKAQAPWLTLSHTVQFKAVRSEVSGFEISPVGRLNFHRVQMGKAVR